MTHKGYCELASRFIECIQSKPIVFDAKVSNMLKKITILLFVGVISAVSMTASATGNEPIRNAKSSLSITNKGANKELPIQATDISKDEVKSTISQATDKSEPILPTMWLLTLALFGFVMLSNRSGV